MGLHERLLRVSFGQRIHQVRPYSGHRGRQELHDVEEVNNVHSLREEFPFHGRVALVHVCDNYLDFLSILRIYRGKMPP